MSAVCHPYGTAAFVIGSSASVCIAACEEKGRLIGCCDVVLGKIIRASAGKMN